GRQHEFLNELVRLVVLDAFQFHRITLLVEPHFCLREIEIQGTLLESPAAQQGSELPGKVKALAEAVPGRRSQYGMGLFVREPVRAANHAAGEAGASSHAASVKLDKDGMCKPIHAGLEAANLVAQALGQHGNHAV